MSGTEERRREEEGEHPELDRAYNSDEGGQVPGEQAAYEGPDPEDDPDGQGDDEDQGV
jgi:hypothetical protein